MNENERSPHHKPMTNATREAMNAFVAQLLKDEEALIELRDYGNLPAHLADAVADYESDLEEDDDA
jgi:hypothetical protein